MKLVTFQTKSTPITPRLGAWIDSDQIVDLTAVAPDMYQFFEQNCIADAQGYIERTQGYLVFGSDLGFRSQMLRFSRNIASTARSYSGKMFTHIK